jgi:hypothetical protein
MGQDESDRQVIDFSRAREERAMVGLSTHDYALLSELSFVRREAQAEANLAYQDWLEYPSKDTYVVYRAAQDRADAAQDYLARCTPRMAS